MFSINYLCIVYITYAISKWITVFKYYFFIIVIWVVSFFCCCNCYSSTYKYICITLITWYCPYHWSFKSNWTISALHSTRIIIYFNWIFCSMFSWFCVFCNKFIIFWYYTIIIDLKLLTIFCFSSGDIYLSLGFSLSCSFVTVSELFYLEFLKTFVILSRLLLPIKAPVTSAVF